MMIPASSTHVSDSTISRPVSRSIETAATTAPELQVSPSGWK